LGVAGASNLVGALRHPEPARMTYLPSDKPFSRGAHGVPRQYQ
jgi:hypothetical protein